MNNQPKQPGKNGFRYKPKYGVIVLCRDAGHQQAVYEYLRQNKHKCKVVTV